MIVQYDYQIFSYQNYGGISRYFYELIRRIKDRELADVYLSLKYSNNYYLKDADFARYSPFFEDKSFKGKVRLQSLINQLIGIKDFRREFDVFHPTYYNPYFLKYLHGKPYVLTIHDMIHELYPEGFGKRNNTSDYKRLLAQRATKIIAISENTKADVIRLLGVDEKKVDVVYHGSSFKARLDDLKAVQTPEKYLLFVGDREKYKNFKRFLKASCKLLKEDDGLFLICAGSRPFNPEEVALIEKLELKEKVLKYPAENDTLSYLYGHALAFVFPSLYEGFGFPVLESMQCGCPAIISNTSCFPEVGGDAVAYFDPTDEQDISSTIKGVIYNSDKRQKLIQAGYENINRFTWDDTAGKTLKVYESCL